MNVSKLNWFIHNRRDKKILTCSKIAVLAIMHVYKELSTVFFLYVFVVIRVSYRPFCTRIHVLFKNSNI